MRVKEGKTGGDGGQGGVVIPASSRMSTLDYLVTKMRRHVRAASTDSITTTPTTPTIVEDEVEMRVSEDEGVVEAEDANIPAPHLRPPMFNPEDYAHALAKYAHMAHLYIPELPKEKKGRGRDREKSVGRVTPPEMSMKQFSSLPELLKRLREDLKMSYLSFVKELVRDPHDGVTLLLDVLKMIQLAQTDLNGTANSRDQQLALRRALIDEHECLSCLRYCMRSTDATLRLAHYHHGLYALAVATMSNLARSRTLALQLLTRACVTSPIGHRQVVDALATLRLRFAEPVKCKFLISMMLSHPHPSFQVWGLRFVNALVASTGSLRERIYLQEELTEAGFDPAALKKIIERSGSDHIQQQAMMELNRWSAAYVDVGSFESEIHGLRTSNATLQEELKKLREANMKLLEENVLLKTVGGDVEERYAALRRRLEQNGLPVAPSPAPSISDSDLSSLNTFRNTTMCRSSISPSRNGDARSAITETDSVIFTQGGQRSVTPVWNSNRQNSTESTSSKTSISSIETVTPCPVYASTSSILPLISRSRHQSSSSTPETRMTSPLRSSTASPIRNCERDQIRDNTPTRSSPTQEPERKRVISGERFNEHMPTTHINMTYCSENTPPSPDVELQCDSSSSSPDGKQIPQELKNLCRSNSRQRQQISEEPPMVNCSLNNVSDKERQKLTSPTQSDSRPGSKSSSHMPTPSSGSPSNAKRKAPKPPSGSASPLSSSTSSLSSSSSTSSNVGGERKDPEYMNVPRQELPQNKSRSGSPASKTRSGSEEGDLDYERDMVVYEAITLANDRIFVDKNNTQGSRSSEECQSSTETQGSLESRDSQGGYLDGHNVRQSVRHYENMVMMSDHFEVVHDAAKKENESNELPKREEEINEKKERKEEEDQKNNNQENKAEKLDDVSEREVEAVMSGLENVLRSAESSLSLVSQETVKENPLLKECFEDRASPENVTNRELEIVPTRIPQLPARSRSRNSQAGSSQRDPVLFLEFESPAETSDTETLLRSSQPLPSPRTIETESTKSFGFIRPERSLRRHETFIDRSNTEHESREERRRGIKRSESFQASNKTDYNSHRSYSPRRRGSTDLLVPLEEKEVHISGRMFTKYTPHEVERRNRVNELITAEMNRRKNRSMEDRLDQWFETQGADGEWTLKWKYPDIRHEDEKPSRQKSSRKHESRSPTRYDNNRKTSKSKSIENRLSSKHQDNKTQSSKYPINLPGAPPKPSRAGKQTKFSNSEISAFSGFKNPNGFRESDYGPNFMLNKPSTRLPDFAELAEYGGRDFPLSRGWSSREKGIGGRRKGEIDPNIPTPDYSATPASTMSTVINGSPAKHILDMPSGLY